MENVSLNGPFKHTSGPFGRFSNPPSPLMRLLKGLYRVYRQQQMRGFYTSHKAKPGVSTGARSRVSLDVPLMTDVSVDETEGGWRGVGTLEGGHAGGTSASAVRPGHQASPATEELGVELLPETLAQQVEGKRVDTGVGEGQEAGTDAGDEVEHGGVHLGVVIGAVQVDDVVREPAEGKEAHEHQHCLGEALPGFDLKRESHIETEGPRDSVGELQRDNNSDRKRWGKKTKERDELTKPEKKNPIGERGQERLK